MRGCCLYLPKRGAVLLSYGSTVRQQGRCCNTSRWWASSGTRSGGLEVRLEMGAAPPVHGARPRPAGAGPRAAARAACTACTALEVLPDSVRIVCLWAAGPRADAPPPTSRQYPAVPQPASQQDMRNPSACQAARRAPPRAAGRHAGKSQCMHAARAAHRGPPGRPLRPSWFQQPRARCRVAGSRAPCRHSSLWSNITGRSSW